MATFITVRFGSDNRLLFNPDCTLCLLVDNIKKRCGNLISSPVMDHIALMDEKLHIINLSNSSRENALPLFTERGIYILLEVKRRQGLPTMYDSILDHTYLDQAAIVKLEHISNPSSSKHSVLARSGSSTALQKLKKASNTKKSSSSSSRATGASSSTAGKVKSKS